MHADKWYTHFLTAIRKFDCDGIISLYEKVGQYHSGLCPPRRMANTERSLFIFILILVHVHCHHPKTHLTGMISLARNSWSVPNVHAVRSRDWDFTFNITATVTTIMKQNPFNFSFYLEFCYDGGNKYKPGDRFITAICDGSCVCGPGESVSCVSLCPPKDIRCTVDEEKIEFSRKIANSNCTCPASKCVTRKTRG